MMQHELLALLCHVDDMITLAVYLRCHTHIY